MPRLPGISQKEAVRVFQKLGYRVVRESGHLILSNGERRLVIPRHDPINAITMGAIARDAGLTPQQFRALLSWERWGAAGHGSGVGWGGDPRIATVRPVLGAQHDLPDPLAWTR
ncbi:type II toxin-antitoxin system HicA family toxin [Cyanobium sp. FGCU-6]|nr:type II toxin-antitoxin system HicA family toxin [Cyanobium sp. FGCU6]